MTDERGEGQIAPAASPPHSIAKNSIEWGTRNLCGPPAMLISVIIVVVVVIFFGGWALTYPSSSDPKNIKYVLWKTGLYKVSLDQAATAMVGDRHRDELVVGKTKAQLREKFGPLLSPADASPYLRGCYQNSSWRDKDVLFIGQSSWMVVFDGDKATNLVLEKGC
ncbi:MAG TPA: hypothetical protein VLL05_10620 [Terriglobales bacterium]|nr:hypothetical protein [Terriglobales bacterium]